MRVNQREEYMAMQTITGLAEHELPAYTPPCHIARDRLKKPGLELVGVISQKGAFVRNVAIPSYAAVYHKPEKCRADGSVEYPESYEVHYCC